MAPGCSLSQITDTIGISYKTAANNCTQIKTKPGATTAVDLIRIALQIDLINHDLVLRRIQMVQSHLDRHARPRAAPCRTSAETGGVCAAARG
jgi:hypothetical protein